MDNPELFESADAGASKTFPLQASSIKKGAYAMLQGRPCKVVEISTSKTGKHGHAKVYLVGIDIFTGKKYEERIPSTHTLDVPFVTKSEYPLLDITEDDFVSLLLPNGETKDDLRLPEGELGTSIRQQFEAGKDLVLTVLSAVGEEAIITVKESTK